MNDEKEHLGAHGATAVESAGSIERDAAPHADTATSYRIEHVADFLKVPADRRATCLEEFKTWMELADHFAVLLTPDGFHPPAFKSFTWIDDGLLNLTVNVTVSDPEGTQLATSTIGPLPYAGPKAEGR